MTQHASDTIGTRIGIPYVNLQLRAEPWVLSIKVNSWNSQANRRRLDAGCNLVTWNSLQTHGGEGNQGEAAVEAAAVQASLASSRCGSPRRGICPA
jgi:hypothetical protein